MIKRISLVAYSDGVSAFFTRNDRTRVYNCIGHASISRVQTLAYDLVYAGEVNMVPGIWSPFVRWSIEPKDQS